MATSSLYKDFVITTREDAKGFVDLLDSFDENAANTQESNVPFYEPTEEEMQTLIKRWKSQKNA